MSATVLLFLVHFEKFSFDGLYHQHLAGINLVSKWVVIKDARKYSLIHLSLY